MGTRPEAVKVAPVALALAEAGRVQPVLVDTGQQPGRVAEALAPFGLAPAHNLRLRRETGSLAELASLTTLAVQEQMAADRPDALLVQGDTLTALMAGLVAFWNQVPVAHLEAGLRTHDLAHPFPEEGSRALLARVTRLHLAPSRRAVDDLADEGIVGDRVVLSGNTVVDALDLLLPRLGPARPAARAGTRLLVTVHRRENWGGGIERVCAALRRIVAVVPHVQVTVVTHPNPTVARQLRTALTDVSGRAAAGIELVHPLPYDQLLTRLRDSDLALTDSGGIQEEAPSLGVPVLVAREVTERPEAVQAGGALVVGTDVDRIVEQAVRLLRDPAARARMQLPQNPFGDGHAARRCAQALAWLLDRDIRPDDWWPPIPDRTDPAEVARSGDPARLVAPGPVRPRH